MPHLAAADKPSPIRAVRGRRSSAHGRAWLPADSPIQPRRCRSFSAVGPDPRSASRFPCAYQRSANGAGGRCGHVPFQTPIRCPDAISPETRRKTDSIQTENPRSGAAVPDPAGAGRAVCASPPAHDAPPPAPAIRRRARTAGRCNAGHLAAKKARTSEKGKISLACHRDPPLIIPPRAERRMVPIAGWSSQVARQAHNLKVVGSNPTPATNESR